MQPSREDKQSRASVDEITGIIVKLEVNGQGAIFVLLASDGLVNRLGTGSVQNTEIDLFIGKSGEGLFEKLRSQVDPAWFGHAGTFTIPQRRGSECDLLIAFRFQGGEETGIRFRYGSESEGPPHDIVQFVVSSVKLTNPWYQRQKAMVVRPKKPWWKFW